MTDLVTIMRVAAMAMMMHLPSTNKCARLKKITRRSNLVQAPLSARKSQDREDRSRRVSNLLLLKRNRRQRLRQGKPLTKNQWMQKNHPRDQCGLPSKCRLFERRTTQSNQLLSVFGKMWLLGWTTVRRENSVEINGSRSFRRQGLGPKRRAVAIAAGGVKDRVERLHLLSVETLTIYSNQLPTAG